MKRLKHSWLCLLLAFGISTGQDKPRVYLQAASHGNTWAARRDQSMEMAKDFENKCPAVSVTIAQDKADYSVILSHIEVGLIIRDNQMEIANREGDVIATSEKGGIRRGVTDACKLIMADWETKNSPKIAAPPSSPKPASPAAVGSEAARQNFGEAADKKLRNQSAGFAEVVDTTLVIHSIYADKDHYEALMRDKKFSAELRKCGFTQFIYTDDANKTFSWELDRQTEARAPYSF